MVTQGVIECQSGKRIEGLRIDTICIHGDTPTALAMARQVRETLEAVGVTIRSFV
ncbi:LamB/YcsF family protein [compost metagenome]